MSLLFGQLPLELVDAQLSGVLVQLGCDGLQLGQQCFL